MPIVKPSKNGPIFSEEELAALRGLGAILEPIYRRLLASGEYVVKDGKLTKKENATDT